MTKARHVRTQTSLAGIPGCTGVIVGMGQHRQGSSCSDMCLFCVMMYCLKHDPYKDINYERPSCFPLIFEKIYSLTSLSVKLTHHSIDYFMSA